MTKAVTLGLAAAATFLAGCSAVRGGTPEPTGSQPTGNTSQPGSGAPKVKHPLDTSKFQAAMCSVLTPQQLKTLGINATGKSGPGLTGPSCSWSEGSGDNRQFAVEASTKYANGLSALYREHDQGQFAVFQPLGEIEGYPAVRAELDNGTDIGSCGISVAVSDSLIYQINLGGSKNRTDPCATTKQIAQMVVQTLKGSA